MDTPNYLPLGLDISKRSFDASLCLATGKYRHKKFANDRAGFQALQSWLQKQTPDRVHACLEATGTYGEALAAFLYEQGQRVSVINPKRSAHFAKSRLARAKTDQVDARLLADFCAQEQPALWTPPAPAYRTLRALVRHREAVEQSLQRERNRLAAAEHPPFIQQALAAQIAVLIAALAAVEAAIREHVAAQPELQQQQALLLSIPGIGEITSWWLLGELAGGADYQNARQVAAAVGLDPRVQQSGQWKGKARLSKQGNALLRKALFLPALSALRWNPLVQALATRLRARGKGSMCIVGAAMRKLLHLAYGVLHTKQAFDPAWTPGTR